jgi:hypothetical protein
MSEKLARDIVRELHSITRTRVVQLSAGLTVPAVLQHLAADGFTGQVRIDLCSGTPNSISIQETIKLVPSEEHLTG